MTSPRVNDCYRDIVIAQAELGRNRTIELHKIHAEYFGKLSKIFGKFSQKRLDELQRCSKMLADAMKSEDHMQIAEVEASVSQHLAGVDQELGQAWGEELSGYYLAVGRVEAETWDKSKAAYEKYSQSIEKESGTNG